MLKIGGKLAVLSSPSLTTYFIWCIVFAYMTIKIINLTNCKSCIIFAVENNR